MKLQQPKTGTLWQHQKSGGEYTITGHCMLEATRKAAVLYRCHETGILWARDADEFLDGRFEQLPLG